MMRRLYQTVKLEWQQLDITYPPWLTDTVRDDVRYIAAVIVICANAFVVGLVLGFILAAVV